MSKTYQIPEGQRVYAIGDIHGHAEVLSRMHDTIEADLRDHPVDKATIVYIGDYIDRGPDSKGVIDQLVQRERVAPHFEHVFLFGNHENGIIDFLLGPDSQFNDWLKWGGVECVESYGVTFDRSESYHLQAERVAQELQEALPKTHQEFLKNLQLHHVVGDYLFVHAGIRPGVPLQKQNPVDLFFTREPFMSHEGHHEYRVVHGHSPPDNKQIDIRPNRINVDTWLYNGGPLTCAVLEDTEVRVLQVWQEA